MPDRTDHRIAWALFGLMTAFYWLTFGGHTYSPDEEMLYWVTESIVERGSFAVPKADGDVYLSVGATGMDGENYAITGPLQSFLAIPFYLAGRLVATAFAPWFQPIWTRLFVSALNGLVGAGTVALMYLLGRKLGYRRSTSLFLALGLGLTTFLSVYARSFWAEPLVTFWLLLAVWAAISYRSSGQKKWAILLGLVLGLCIATKPQSVIAVPAYAGYLLILMMKDHTDWRTRLRWFGETAIWCVLGGLLPLLLVFGYNYVRFGMILETGYTEKIPLAQRAFIGTPLIGLYGFLFSAGKSFFLYAPLTILGMVGTRALAKRHKPETWLLWFLILSHLLFYITWKARWYNGGSWGPRYLTYIIPLALLPAGAFLESGAHSRRLRLSLASLFFLIGLFVQTGAIVTNENSYYNQKFPEGVGMNNIFYDPNYSPVWGHWTLWSERYEMWKEYRSALEEHRDAKYAFSGWLQTVEVEDLAPFGRWTKGWVAVDTYSLPEQSLDVTVTYWRPLDDGVPQEPLVFSMDGLELESSTTALDDGESGRHADTVSVLPQQIATFPPRIVFDSTLWSPAAVGISADGRDLGVFLESISVQVDGREMQTGQQGTLFTRIPLDASRQWHKRSFGWFYWADVPHLADTWWWYVSVTGFLPNQVRTVQWVGLLAIGLIGSASLILLIRAIRSSPTDSTVSGSRPTP